jgi:protocatechuate 3,4-dioxygenase beta subunit
LLARQQAAQSPPARQYSAAAAGTGQIGGIVTTADGSQPLKLATVRLQGPQLRGSRELATDDQGRFLFAGLVAGSYTVGVDKPGYIRVTYGQKRYQGSGTPISLTEGQRVLDIRVQLPKGAVIAGRVLDEAGQPYPACA